MILCITVSQSSYFTLGDNMKKKTNGIAWSYLCQVDWELREFLEDAASSGK